MHTQRRRLSIWTFSPLQLTVSVINERIESLPTTGLDHRLAHFFWDTRRKNGRVWASNNFQERRTAVEKFRYKSFLKSSDRKCVLTQAWPEYVKSAYEPIVAHLRPELIPVSVAWSDYNSISTPPPPPGLDASLSQGYPPVLILPVPIYTPGWREAPWE